MRTVRFSKFSLLLYMIVRVVCVSAQTTTVSATVTDTDGTAWANGKWSATYVYQASLGQPVVAGQSFQVTYSGALDGTGSFSQTVTSTGGIVPATTPPASGWTFCATPNVSSPTTYCTTARTITGGTFSATTILNAAILPPRLTCGNPISAYVDVEITNPVAGCTYYNVTSAAQRCYSGSAWAACGGGSSGVPSVNGITSPVTVAAGTGATVSTAGSTITVSATGSGSSVGNAGDIQMVGSTAGSFAAAAINQNANNIIAGKAFGVTGTNPSNVTSAIVMDFFSNSGRLLIYGGNTSTPATFDMFLASSNFSVSNNIIHCDYITCQFNTNMQANSNFTVSGNTATGTLGVTGAATLSTIYAPLTTPSSSSATCTAGQISWDANFIYICTATNVTKRAALATF